MLWMEKGGKLHLSTLGGTVIQSTATEGGNKLKNWGVGGGKIKDLKIRLFCLNLCWVWRYIIIYIYIFSHMFYCL